MLKLLGGYWIYLACFLAGAVPTAWIAWDLHQGAVARLELKAETARADGLAEGLKAIEQAQAVIRAQANEVLQSLSALPSIVHSRDADLLKLMREKTSDPKYDCRRLPLPEPYLDGLRRGSAADDHPSP